MYLVEGHRRRLRNRVVNEFRNGKEGGQRGDGDDVSMVLLYQRGEELADHVEVGDDVDVERFAHTEVAAAEGRIPHCDAGVVEDHGWVAELGLDEGADALYFGLAADIALEEGDFWVWGSRVSGVVDIVAMGVTTAVIGEGLHVQDDHIDALVCELPGNRGADAAATAGD